MRQLNSYIDHTLLKPTKTQIDIITLCKEAIEHQFYAVCINGCYVSLAKQTLQNTSIKICSVVGFPLGAMSTDSKIEEAKNAIKNGADEIDMVLNIGLLKSAAFDAVKNDIYSVKKAITHHTLKVILETCYLTKVEIIKACELSIAASADYIKTSTGFGTAGATLENIELMKSIAKDNIKIKASGGIKDADTTRQYINLGVDRIGTSSGINIVKGNVL